MKPVMQTRFGEGKGNCFQAAVASLMEIPLEDAPDVWKNGPTTNWVDVVTSWAKAMGLMWYETDAKESGACYLLGCTPGFRFILSGVSPRGLRHAVVAEMGRDWQPIVIHDPHPEGGGVKEPYRYGFLVPLDVAKWRMGEGK